MNDIQKRANAIARKAGYSRATEIVFGDVKEGKVLSHTKYGYRKNGTGEYVDTAKIFGERRWDKRNKNNWDIIRDCYYQHAKTIVMLPMPKKLRMIRLNEGV